MDSSIPKAAETVCTDYNTKNISHTNGTVFLGYGQFISFHRILADPYGRGAPKGGAERVGKPSLFNKVTPKNCRLFYPLSRQSRQLTQRESQGLVDSFCVFELVQWGLGDLGFVRFIIGAVRWG